MRFYSMVLLMLMMFGACSAGGSKDLLDTKANDAVSKVDVALEDTVSVDVSKDSLQEVSSDTSSSTDTVFDTVSSDTSNGVDVVSDIVSSDTTEVLSNTDTVSDTVSGNDK